MPVINIGPPTNHVPKPDMPFAEFPKWLHFEGKPSLLVHNKAEENAVLGVSDDEQEEVLTPESVNALVQVFPHVPDILPEPIAAPVPSLSGTNDEREMLNKIAEARGIKVDGRWRLERLRRVVEVNVEAQEQQANQ